jgi:hypothetical protein
MKKQLEQRIAQAHSNIENAQDQKQKAEGEIRASLNHSGVPQKLYNLYLAFCESLDPEFGQRGGFSVTWNADHQGSVLSSSSIISLINKMPQNHLIDQFDAIDG